MLVFDYWVLAGLGQAGGVKEPKQLQSASVQEFRNKLFLFYLIYSNIEEHLLAELHYPARALSALGLLLSVSDPTVRWGKTFCCVGGSPSRKRP